uniref:allophycocyanin beta 18 subunit n=1 Tax=Hypnea brasiliensis TaxID=1866962 RepID=UPI0023F47B8B|nr:allophycocyanin beta 18 subunit [Hypnea brasiliensis]WCH55295.1 allophycocyanin beta 18 subunit [Hypnea brasiliensis]WDY84731.1 allophycocyanin beta 18 subunit [Hypnea brasiliensis]
MQDAITNILNKYDLTGKYLDTFALTAIENYFSNAFTRIKVIEFINSKSSKIVREAGARLYNEQPELLRPGGNSYTTRRYAACLRDIEYYLRYASYAIIAGDINILNERVLDGLRETYNSLTVPIGPTVRSIKILEEIIQNELQFTSPNLKTIINEPFEHMISSLGEENI